MNQMKGQMSTSDNNRDGIVNMIDIAKVAGKWLEKVDWVE